MPRSPLVLALALSTGLLAACGGGGAATGAGGSTAVAVQAGDRTCRVADTSLAAGPSTLAVHNGGGDVTEVYVYGSGDRVYGEVENVGPGTTRRLAVDLPAGTYAVACKPGMRGNGIRTAITVTGKGGTEPVTDPRLATGIATYTAYVRAQVADMVTRTGAFTAAVERGDTARAKALYAASRVPWERIEPVAEQFGDLDPRLDLREDRLAPGQSWTGWHRLEKDLWTTGRGEPGVARQLLADVRELQRRVATVALTPTRLGNGAAELLNEVATSKVTGEEERYSHVDLVDFSANVDGAQAAYDALRPVAAGRDAALVAALDSRFAAVQRALTTYGSGASFVSYRALSPTQVRDLSQLVDALSEPLSRLTATVVRKA